LDVVPATHEKQARILATAAATVPFDAPSRPQGAPWAWRHARVIGLASLLVIAAGGLAIRWSGRSTTTAHGDDMTGTPLREVPAVGSSTAPGHEGKPSGSSAIAAAAIEPASLPSVSVDDLASAPRSNELEGSSHKPRRNVASLQDELALVDKARVALAQGNAREALARVGEYRARFAAPRFADEADALEVSALAALGDHAAARSKAERFVVAHPDSPYLQRVRSVVRAAE
ncbi:MAG: hypothetical protein K0S65_3018, partial [Labilithrix sp.]|nr:hypothetical protein [Labilithrix sp.]